LAVARALGDGDAKNYGVTGNDKMLLMFCSCVANVLLTKNHGVTADPQFIGWKIRQGQVT
jgi:hypothetical protein